MFSIKDCNKLRRERAMADRPGAQIIYLNAGQSITIEWFRGRAQNSIIRLSIFQNDLWRVVGDILTPDDRNWHPYAPTEDQAGNPEPFQKKTKSWRLRIEGAVSDKAMDGAWGSPEFRGMAISSKFQRVMNGIE